jgi:hypothetical protein
MELPSLEFMDFVHHSILENGSASKTLHSSFDPYSFHPPPYVTISKVHSPITTEAGKNKDGQV